ncbi:MAG: hypothetical protein IIC24_11135, partial [Chloroflexi bacterium]|nr:hypothetical protein [Chloroflexota bacterium]
MFSRTHTTDPSPAVQDTTGLRRKKRFGWRRKGLLVILLLALFVIRVDTHHLSPARDIGSPYLFSPVEWEIAKFPQKWLHRLWDLLPWNGSTREECIATVEEYLELARRVEKEKDRVEGLLIRSRTAIAPGGIAKEKGPPSRDYL